MNHKYFRLLTVAVVLFTVHFTQLPAAEAQGLAGTRAGVHSSTDWFGTALAWMADLFAGGHTGHSTTLRHLTSRDLSAGGYKINTGSCIDPNGVSGCTSF
jgi:hypothetical protein